MSVDVAVLRDPDEVVPRVLAVAALVRLIALTVSVLTMLDQTLPLQVLLALGLLAGSSYMAVSRRGELALAIRHPSLVLVDVVLVLMVLAVVGVDSPAVIATLSTALVVGLLLPPAPAAVVTVALVSGYLLIWRVTSPADAGASFTAVVTTPVLYVSFVLIGFAVRSARLRQAEAERRLGLALAAAANERERSRLAREMHDTLAKTLHGLSMGADALPHWVAHDRARAAGAARELAEGLRQATTEARALLGRMRADDPGSPFGEVVRRVCHDWADRVGTPVEVQAADTHLACTELRYELLAVLAEALENVRRHAAAQKVSVTFDCAAGQAELRVEDDGRGFDVAAVPRDHWGLVGMRERMAQVGGQLSVRSSPERGTEVRASAPVVDGARPPFGFAVQGVA